MVRKGTYILIIHLSKKADILVGKIVKHHFEPGYYAYVGSALNALDARLMRHFGYKPKKIHWHIDYLLQRAKAAAAFVYESDTRNECRIAKAMAAKYPVPVSKFGSSDCGCEGHLFYIGKKLPTDFHGGEIRVGKYNLHRWSTDDQPQSSDVSSSPRRPRTAGGR